MNVSITHTDGVNFKAKTEKAEFDVIPKEITPVELFAVGTISCSGTDMIKLPEKQGYAVKNLQIGAEIVRNEEYPQKFNTMHVTYSFDSTADDETAKRWVMASLETYCSTINTIRSDVSITYTIIYNGKTLCDNKAIISGHGSSQGAGIDLGELDGCGV